MADPTIGDFQPSTLNDFQPTQDQEPSITQHTPEDYAALTTQNALQSLNKQGLLPYAEGKDILDYHKTALDRAQNFQADMAKQAAAKQQELLQRAAAAQRGPGNEPSLLETEKAEEKGVELKATEAQKQWEQGPVASAEAEQLAKQYGHPVFIQQLPPEQRTQIAQIDTAYQRLNQLQALHQNMVQSAGFGLASGGVIKSTIGGLLTQPGLTSRYARDFNAYQDESLTPLAVGIFGDKAASATKDKQVELMKGTLPTAGDDLTQAGHKIFMMKNTLMERLQAMKRGNQGTISTGEISDLQNQLNPDFTSKETQKNNAFAPINQQPVVNVGNSQQGEDQVNNAIVGNLQRQQQQAQATSGSPTPLWAQGAQQGIVPQFNQ